MEHTTKASTHSSRHLPQHTMTIPLGSPAPLFVFDSCVLPEMANGLVVRQGEPTIVVAVLQNIARGHGTHHKGINSQFKTPATTHHGHTSWVTCPPFCF